MKCKHCGKAIVWDDWCYIHNASDLANCVVVQGESLTVLKSHAEPEEADDAT